MASFNINNEFVKYTVVALAAPIWIPFIKRIWHEINFALREEGGVFGRVPSPAEMEEIRRLKSMEEDPLVNEPLAYPGTTPKARKNAAGPAPAGGPGPAAGPAPSGGPSRPQFRDDVPGGSGAFR